MSTLFKTAGIASVAAVWLMATWICFGCIAELWKVRVDVPASFRAIGHKFANFVSEPAKLFRGLVQEIVELKVSIARVGGVRGGVPRFQIASRATTYDLRLENPSSTPIKSVKLTLQLPLFTEMPPEISEKKGCIGERIGGPQWVTVGMAAQGTPVAASPVPAPQPQAVTPAEKPMFNSTTFLTVEIEELRAGGYVVVSLLAYNFDPSDRNNGEALSDPLKHFVMGTYEVERENSVKEDSFYAPAILSYDAGMGLGASSIAPGKLKLAMAQKLQP